MRGEYGARTAETARSCGSSPHAWGIHGQEVGQDTHARFIPTCVGNTPMAAPYGWGQPVHPHMRGEYHAAIGIMHTTHGSSPHAWGIHLDHATQHILSRFIPTCVGNTPYKEDKKHGYSVHPHMRGEYSTGRVSLAVTTGSSPHAWGIRKTALPMPSRHAVHPHMRGEYMRWAAAIMVTGGSSPHAWGIPVWPLAARGAFRFIPTCVGNTFCANVGRQNGAVHPHMRGEYYVVSVQNRLLNGSSPHAWGIRCPSHQARPCCRFIPTCVGNTPSKKP